jgi:hypothetical protein
VPLPLSKLRLSTSFFVLRFFPAIHRMAPAAGHAEEKHEINKNIHSLAVLSRRDTCRM